MDEEWRRRVATHITAWKAPKGLEFNEREATFRESYLRYILRLLLTSTGERLMQGPSQFHIGLDYRANCVAYYERLRFCFHLRRANPQLSSGLNESKLLTKRSYIHFLFYGIHIEDAHVRLLNYAAYVFDPQKKYLYSCCNAADIFPSWPLVTHRTPCLWFQKMVTLLKESSGWIPRKLDIVAPSHEFLEAASSESVSEFLSSVEDINVEFFNDVGFSEVADVLTKLFKTNKLSAESICIKTGVKTQQGQGSDTEIKLPAKVSGRCQSGEHKTLCLPFISSGPCSLAWLLSLPELSLKNLELTVREEGYESHLNAIHLILQSHTLSQFQFECTISICCESQIPPLLLRMSQVVSQLRMCPPVKDVHFIIDIK